MFLTLKLFCITYFITQTTEQRHLDWHLSKLRHKSMVETTRNSFPERDTILATSSHVIGYCSVWSLKIWIFYGTKSNSRNLQKTSQTERIRNHPLISSSQVTVISFKISVEQFKFIWWQTFHTIRSLYISQYIFNSRT